jgi:hypothetical protein
MADMDAGGEDGAAGDPLLLSAVRRRFKPSSDRAASN